VDIPAYLQAADALLFPSRYEGFGLAIVEALACGVPVVSTPVGVARDLAPGLQDWCLPDWERGSTEMVAAARSRLDGILSRPPQADAVRALVDPGYGLAAWRSAMREALQA
jgi:glycosyltransferase involved in cell wall biosynthesis